MNNVVITSLHDFIHNFSKDGTAKVTNKNILALTQKMNAVCKRLDESNALPCETLVHVLTGLTSCGVTMINTEHFSPL